jgi:hypothetical protein
MDMRLAVQNCPVEWSYSSGKVYREPFREVTAERQCSGKRCSVVSDEAAPRESGLPPSPAGHRAPGTASAASTARRGYPAAGSYEETATRLWNGLEKVLAAYGSSCVPQERRIHQFWQESHAAMESRNGVLDVAF